MTDQQTTPAMFYWLKTSGSMGHGQSGPWPKEIAEKKRDAFRKANPGKACSIELAWEAPFEKMIPVKIEENRFGAKGSDIGYVFKVDAKWFYVYVNTRCAKKFHRTKDGMFGPGREVFHAHSGGHSHAISDADVKKIEEFLKGGNFDTGFKCNIPD